jgi:hypothetical protein
MSTAYAGPVWTWGHVLDTWRELQVPEGWRPELTADGIQMTEPVQGVYSRTVRVPFGDPVEIGEPFGVRLETTEF